MEEAISHQRIDLEHICEDLNSVCSRQTATGSTLDNYLTVTGNKLVISCKTHITKRTVIKGDLNVYSGNIYLTNGAKELSMLNGKGNLVIGVKMINQEGSYNVAISGTHTPASYEGLVDGYNNTVSGVYNSVTGGSYNTASGFCNSFMGGTGNMPIGEESTVSSGTNSVALGFASLICGGHHNQANGEDISVSG